LKYVCHPSFDDPAARNAILSPLADPAAQDGSPRLRLAPVSNHEVAATMLSSEQEAHLFRKMNYLKWRASRLKQQVEYDGPSPALLDEIERHQADALAVKHRIVEINMPLVIFVVKKRVRVGEELSEYISEGNVALVQAVDGFDFARGNRFSTYATWAIRNAIASKLASDRRYRVRPFAIQGASLEAPDPGVAEFEEQVIRDRRRSVVRRWFAHLGEREKWILTNRYGLGGGPEWTYKQIGRALGISKQRANQLARRAEHKLSRIARREAFEAIEI
jgi:RNA polymerase primary sigma factor